MKSIHLHHAPRYRDTRPLTQRLEDWWFGVCDGGRTDERALLAGLVLIVLLVAALGVSMHRGAQPVHVWEARRVYVVHVVKQPTPRKAGPRD